MKAPGSCPTSRPAPASETIRRASYAPCRAHTPRLTMRRPFRSRSWSQASRETHFVSAVGRRQQSLVQASLAKQLNDFVRHAAVSFTLRRPVGKIGNQGMSTRDEIFVSRGFDADRSGRNTHGSSPFNRVNQGVPISLDRSKQRMSAEGAGRNIGSPANHRPSVSRTDFLEEKAAATNAMKPTSVAASNSCRLFANFRPSHSPRYPQPAAPAAAPNSEPIKRVSMSPPCDARASANAPPNIPPAISPVKVHRVTMTTTMRVWLSSNTLFCADLGPLAVKSKNSRPQHKASALHSSAACVTANCDL